MEEAGKYFAENADLKIVIKRNKMEEEPKQETLEEAAEKYVEEDNNNRYYNDFIAGARWQAERMYSEEEIMEMFHKFSMHLPFHYEFLVKEQLKKNSMITDSAYYDKIIHDVKNNIIQLLIELPEEKTNNVLSMMERAINDDGVSYQFKIVNKELIDISLGRDVISFSDLCVEDLLFMYEYWVNL